MSANTIHKLVLIACSTGGPKALHRVIPKLSKRLDAPVVIVQHMPKGFTNTLAQQLNEKSEITVKEAENGAFLEKGCVYIAKGGTHLLIGSEDGQRLMIREADSQPVNGLRPCADVTFSSVSNCALDFVVNVVLTGMGNDGYAGICEIRKNFKSYTIAQHKDTCVVYGMPKAIVDNGLADIVLPLDEIGLQITKKVGVY